MKEYVIKQLQVQEKFNWKEWIIYETSYGGLETSFICFFIDWFYTWNCNKIWNFFPGK